MIGHQTLLIWRWSLPVIDYILIVQKWQCSEDNYNCSCVAFLRAQAAVMGIMVTRWAVSRAVLILRRGQEIDILVSFLISQASCLERHHPAARLWFQATEQIFMFKNMVLTPLVRSELILHPITTHYLFNIVTLFQTLLIRYKCILVHCFVSLLFSTCVLCLIFTILKYCTTVT